MNRVWTPLVSDDGESHCCLVRPRAGLELGYLLYYENRWCMPVRLCPIDKTWVLCICFFHIICDGRCWGVIKLWVWHFEWYVA